MLRTFICSVAVLALFAVGLARADDLKNKSNKDSTDKHKATQTGDKTSAATKVAADGFKAMRAMHAARVAIFNGDVKLCTESLDEANTALAMAAKDEAVAKVKADLIPIDGSLALADTFVPSEKKAAHIAKANEHIKKGESEKGIAELRLGEIEVNFSRVLMPLEATKKRLADAMSLAKEHKYYEANLALKAAEDGLELDSVTLFEFPKAAGATTEKGEGKTEELKKDANEKKTGDKDKTPVDQKSGTK